MTGETPFHEQNTNDGTGILPISRCYVSCPQTRDLKQKKYLFIIHKGFLSKHIPISQTSRLILISVFSSGAWGWAYNPKDQHLLQMKKGAKPASTVYSFLCAGLEGLKLWFMMNMSDNYGGIQDVVVSSPFSVSGKFQDKKSYGTRWKQKLAHAGLSSLLCFMEMINGI